MTFVEALAGGLVVVYVLFDLFQAVLMPRPAGQRVRLARVLVRATWAIWRRVGLRMGSAARREQFLGSYAPLALLLLLVCWMLGLILGYGLCLHALAGEVHPAPANLGTALYFAGTSLFTLGFGDIVPVGGPARAISLAAAASGLGVIAVAITFIYSLFGFFHRREQLVVTLDARAGAPPSGLALLEIHARLGLLDDLPRLLRDGEQWAAEVLEGHLAYPLLAHFRSTHEHESWVAALGALLDASTLLLTTVDGVARGPAHLMYALGRHLAIDLANYFLLQRDSEVGVERGEFEEARQRLAAAGFRLVEGEAAWRAFVKLRVEYASALNAMARYWSVPPAQWVGDRSALPRHLASSKAR